MQPLAVNGQPTTVQISLHPGSVDDIHYTVQAAACQGKDDHKEPTLYSQGTVTITTDNISSISLPTPPVIDLEALKVRTQRATISSAQCYDAFNTLGLVYGPSHRGIKQLHQGDNEVLAQLGIPYCVQDAADAFILHPSILDAALQAAISLINDHDAALLPFALGSVDIFEPSQTAVWAWIRYAGGSSAADAIHKLDIDLLNERGQICVSLRDFTARGWQPVNSEPVVQSNKSNERPKTSIRPSEESAKPLTETSELLQLCPVWDHITITASEQEKLPTDSAILMLGLSDEQTDFIRQRHPQAVSVTINPEHSHEQIAAQLKPYNTPDHIIWQVPAAEDLSLPAFVSSQTPGVISLFKLIKALLLLGYGDETLCWSIITT